VRKGFTLIEVLIAMGILAVTLLGLLSAIVITQKESISNIAREEATRVLSEELNVTMVTDYDSVTFPNCPPDDSNRENYLKSECENALISGTGTISRVVRNFTLQFGKSACMIEDSTLNVKTIWMDICWKLRGKTYHLSGSTVIRKEK
jgi:prepilin-type N-terminal cleavage/methylation domain-containing protein